MANFYNPITACLKKPGREDANAVEEHAKDDEKKTSTDASPNAAPAGWIQGITSGVYNAGAGGARWVASTTYNVGATVLGTGSQLVRKVGTRKDKAKNE